MIISDLSHFEEVVSEAPSIVGGAATQKTTTADQLLSKDLLDRLSPESVARLRKIKVKVKTVTKKKKGVSVTVSTGTAKGGGVAIASSSASAEAEA
jgi:hypothetical protein